MKCWLKHNAFCLHLSFSEIHWIHVHVHLKKFKFVPLRYKCSPCCIRKLPFPCECSSGENDCLLAPFTYMLLDLDPISGGGFPHVIWKTLDEWTNTRSSSPANQDRRGVFTLRVEPVLVWHPRLFTHYEYWQTANHVTRRHSAFGPTFYLLNVWLYMKKQGDEKRWHTPCSLLFLLTLKYDTVLPGRRSRR